jgi:peptidoglycan/LPS O-acetylase OafA/YrhL
MIPKKYRPEIDGLRALAVLSVIFFHFGIPGFTGGFVGVDVFFVISGFLITSLIIHELDNGTFSFMRFWERRAQRILPASTFWVIITFILGWLILLPLDFKDLGQSILSQSFFSSNIFFWKKSGYFDGPSEMKPLLHTWSLSVEEQFYMVFPLILFGINKYSKSFRPYFFLFAIIFSFFLNIWGVFHYPAATFYLLPTRAWELLFGSLISILPQLSNRKTIKEILSWLGLFLILYGIVKFSKNTIFPGFNALFPSLGTALIIWSNFKEKTYLGKVLSLSLFTKIGLISYSLYLIHWPILVFSKYYLGRELHFFEILLGIGLSFILSYFSWRFIETPFRTLKFLPNKKKILSYSGYTLSILFCVGLITHFYNGFQFRVPKRVITFQNGVLDKNPREEECHSSMTPEKVLEGKLCKFGVGDPKILSFGDSHSDSIMPEIEKLANQFKITTWHATYSGCPPIFDVFRVDQPVTHKCKEFNEAIWKTITKLKIKNVLLAARWSVYAQGWDIGETNGLPDPFLGDKNLISKTSSDSKIVFEKNIIKTIKRFTDSGINVYIFLEVPGYKFPIPQKLAKESWFGRDFSPNEIAHPIIKDSFVSSIFSKISNNRVKILDPSKILCSQGEFCKISLNYTPLYYDSNHLTTYGASYLKSLFDKMFQEIESEKPNNKKGIKIAKGNF